MTPRTVPSETELREKKDERRRIIIALLFLLLGFSCIFCSSQSALWLIDRHFIDASMLSLNKADYSSGPGIAMAPLSGDIAAEAEHDEEQLLLKQTPIAGGLGVVVLPNPIPTPEPTVIALLPTPTPTLTPTVSAPPGPPPATSTSVAVAPTPTDAPPTSIPPTAVPPTPIPPTAVPPTVPLPTSLPPTSPPPTSVPPTSIPPTSVPPTSPPPATATSTQTAVPPATPTPTGTATPIPTPTDTLTPTPTDTPTATATNTPIPPSVQFSASNYTANETDVTVSINVTLSGTSGVTVTVDYATSDLTASAGSDYAAAAGQLTFPPGNTSQTFQVTITDDIIDEPDEMVRLTLSNPNGATPGTPFAATLTIIDDDTGGTCPGLYPVGEPNIGSPDGNFARIACDVGMIVDLGATPINSSGDMNYDLVYYELQGMPPPTPPEQIFMDQLVVELGQSPAGPWYQVFYWGDGGPDSNTNLGQAGYGNPTETDNLLIPMTVPPLYGTAPYTTGIAIDVDQPLTAAGAPPGPYRYIRFYAPISNDGPEIDAIQILP